MRVQRGLIPPCVDQQYRFRVVQRQEIFISEIALLGTYPSGDPCCI